MNKWLFDLSTGIFIGRSMSGGEEFLEANKPEGFDWIGGVTDWQSQRVDLDTGQLIDYIPPVPGPAADYEWSSESRRWRKTAVAIMRDQRHAAAMAEIEHLETKVQPRILREVQLARLDSRQPDPETVSRLRAMDQRIEALRADIAPAQDEKVSSGRG
jgi:hypothetical protein